jgi:hypothetical protein
MFGAPKGDIGYDIESFPNLFTAVFRHVKTNQQWKFEVSDRKNESESLKLFMAKCHKNNCRWVGFNNLFYDYPVIHFLFSTSNPTAANIYQKSISILRSTNRFGHIIWDKDMVVPQIDLFKIWHFDNVNRMTSLKMLEFNMRLPDIKESTVEFDTDVPENKIDEVMDYNCHDVLATNMFYDITRGKQPNGSWQPAEDKIAFREELSEKYGKNFLNHNDTKVGKDFFIMKLEDAKKGSCYQYVNGRREPIQTIRESIHFGSLILPSVEFKTKGFQDFLKTFKDVTVKSTKGALKDKKYARHVHNGFEFVFGTGGIHGSVSKQFTEATMDATMEKKILTKQEIDNMIKKGGKVLPLSGDKYDHDFAKRYLCKLNKS